MALKLPSSLSPSKVNTFRECGYSFKLSVIDKVPQPTNLWALRGTLAHRTLDRLYFEVKRGDRNRGAAREIFDEVWEKSLAQEELSPLKEWSDEAKMEQFRQSTWEMVEKDFEVEDPNSITAIATELLLEFEFNGLILRGIIDRLDLNGDGSITVTDYKTGRVPGTTQERDKLGGVQFYALLCEKVLGVSPASVQLIYLKESMAIISRPTPQTLKATQSQTQAIWKAVVHACENDNFRPRVSRLCGHCCYSSICPAQPVLGATDDCGPSQL